MVLDAKAMEWASANGIDTAKLKAAKIPIYGKWYFPDIPAGVPLVNLKSGEIQTFDAGLRAGEVLFVARADLRRARLGPYAAVAEEKPSPSASPTPAASEPAAPPPVVAASAAPAAPSAPPRDLVADEPLGPDEQIHLPGPSIYPLVLGLGLAIFFFGLVAGPPMVRVFVALLGVVYLLAGGIGWALENHRAGLAH